MCSCMIHQCEDANPGQAALVEKYRKGWERAGLPPSSPVAIGVPAFGTQTVFHIAAVTLRATWNRPGIS